MSTSNYHHGDLHNALVDAALTILRDVGPAAISLRAVARQAGVSAMAPYRHFSDKEALLASVAALGFELFARRLRQATARERDPRSALVAQGLAYIRFARDEAPLFRLMFGPVISGAEAMETLATAGAPAYAVLRDAVRALQPDATAGTHDDMTLACWSIVHGLACLLVDGKAGHGQPPAVIEAQATRVISLLLPDPSKVVQPEPDRPAT